MPERSKTMAYVLPFGVFAGFLALTQLLHGVGHSFWLEHSEFWIYPVQTVVCGLLVFAYRRDYVFRPFRSRGFLIAGIIGFLIFVLWIAPQAFLRYPPRVEGFNPTLLYQNPTSYWVTVVFRFLRLVIIVPLVEEIFWRGFFLRYLIAQDFERVPFGTFSWLSFLMIVGLFMVSHAMPDWPAAIIAGALFNLVAYFTRSLSACIVAHAVANALLGLWIMQTQQWGFW